MMSLVKKISAAMFLCGLLVTNASAAEQSFDRSNSIKNVFTKVPYLSVSFINYTDDDYSTSAYYTYPNKTYFKRLYPLSSIAYPTIQSDLVCLDMVRLSDHYDQDLGCYDHSVQVSVKPAAASKNDKKGFTVEIK